MSERVDMIVSNGHGPDPRVQKEAEALVEGGYDVRVLAWDRERSHPPSETIGGVRIERFHHGKQQYGDLFQTWKGLRHFHRFAYQAMRSDPPLICHSHDQDTCRVGLRWKREGRGFFVFDAHDFYWTWLTMGRPKSVLRRVGARLLKRRDRRYAIIADLLITSSNGMGGYPGLAEHYINWNANPKTILNLPDIDEISSPMPDKFTVGYIGNVREVEMFDHLMSAIALLPPEKRPCLRIAGSGKSHLEVKQLVETRSSSLGVQVKVTGRYDMSQLHEIMSDVAVQFCVYTADRGDFKGDVNLVRAALPNKLFESAMMGRKIVTISNSVMGDWTKSNDWGWTCEPGDAENLAQILSHARDEWETGNRSFNVSDDVPVWSQEAEKLRSLYAGMINQGGQ